jgi:glycosyltransferase involved in cell wall biosynthesis
MAPYGEAFLKDLSRARPAAPRPRFLLDLTDCLARYASLGAACRGFPPARRFALWWDAPVLSEEEPRWVGRVDEAWVVAEPEREALAGLGAETARIRVVPNGVPPAAKGRKPARPAVYPPGRPVATFVGNLGYAPNEDAVHWFVREAWPRVTRRVPGAVLAVVGGSPRKALRDLDDGDSVRVTGHVPDLAPYLVHAAVSVAPLRVAVGFQNKVALSLAHGVPVVATPQALRWLAKGLRGGTAEADGAVDFARLVAERLERPSFYARAAVRAGRLLVRRSSWEATGRLIEASLDGKAEGV